MSQNVLLTKVSVDKDGELAKIVQTLEYGDRLWLYGRISSDYNTPMTNEQINRLSEKQVRTIYNNMQASHNVGSITQITAARMLPLNGCKRTRL